MMTGNWFMIGRIVEVADLRSDVVAAPSLDGLDVGDIDRPLLQLLEVLPHRHGDGVPLADPWAAEILWSVCSS